MRSSCRHAAVLGQRLTGSGFDVRRNDALLKRSDSALDWVHDSRARSAGDPHLAGDSGRPEMSYSNGSTSMGDHSDFLRSLSATSDWR